MGRDMEEFRLEIYSKRNIIKSEKWKPTKLSFHHVNKYSLPRKFMGFLLEMRNVFLIISISFQLRNFFKKVDVKMKGEVWFGKKIKRAGNDDDDCVWPSKLEEAFRQAEREYPDTKWKQSVI